MYTLILEANEIPDFTTVRKVTGTQQYKLKRKISIYYSTSKSGSTIEMPKTPQEVSTKGVVFLVSDEHINGYPETTKFAIDFEDVGELMEFCDMKLIDHS